MRYLNDEESLRRWLEGRASEATLEQTLESIRRADRFAIQNHMRNMRLWGAPPKSARRAVLQLMAHPAFRKSEARAYNAFRAASKLYTEFLEMLESAPVSEATAAQEAGQPPSKPEEAVQPIEEAPYLQAELAALLQDARYDALRAALLADGITTLREFRELNLWMYLNRKGLYGIEQRYAVYKQLLREVSERAAVKDARPITVRIATPSGVRSERNATAASPVASAAATSPVEGAGAAALSEMVADLSVAGDYAFTKPISLRYRGKLLPERNWQGVYMDLCRLLTRDEERAMRRIVDDPSTRGISFHYRNEQRKRDLRLPKAFAPGCYLEGNIGATDIMRRIRALWLEFKLGDQLEIRYRWREDAKPGRTASGSAPAEAEQIEMDMVASTSRIEDEAASDAKEAAALREQVEDEVLRADLDGIALDALRERFPNVRIAALKQLLDASPKLIEMPDERIIHADALVDFERISAKLQEILERLLNKHSGYVSSALLFEYARADSEIQIFLNDLGDDGERNLYCIARYLFAKIGWKGHRYAFTGGNHISRGGERTVSSVLDVILKYARDAGGFFAYADLEEYLQRLGMRTSNLRTKMKLGSEALFFYYSPEEVVLAESLGIDEAWLAQAHRALAWLFENVADHVVLRSLWDSWYEQLPALPGRRSWTPLLLQYVLKFYGERLGARTIRAMDSQSGAVVHCMVVSNQSEVQNFADAVAVHLIDSGIAKRYFAAEELRKLLVAGELIAGNELINNMPKALEGDPRFAWDVAGEHVHVRI